MSEVQQFHYMKEQQENWRKNSAQHDYRKFLTQFKVHPCSVNHDPDLFCFYFHSYFEEHVTSHSVISTESFSEVTLILRDRRRNPYGHLNRILYEPECCPNIQSGCKDENCKFCHNMLEYNYHPLIFKTQNCDNFYECSYPYCNRLHYQDFIMNQKTQSPILRFSEFFRFDILTFKTSPCKKQYGHDKNSCLYYHNQKDYRRPNFEQYDHIQCKKSNGNGCYREDCEFSHNKIEQLYHPSRYKSKFCEKHYISRKNAVNPNDESSFKSLCPYGKVCSFAHNEEEISIPLIDNWPKNLEFYLYAYKTVWCPITTDHNRSECVYAHNIQDYRRNPKEHHYDHQECPLWKKNQKIKSIDEAGCPDGMSCQKCHGWKEKDYHPMVYCKSKPYDSKVKEKCSSNTASDGAKEKTQSSYVKDFRNSEINDQFISKKLGTGFNEKKKIDIIVNQQLNKGNNNAQKQLYAPGTPFFKGTRNGKTKSQSEKGDISKAETQEKTSNIEQRGSINSETVYQNPGETEKKKNKSNVQEDQDQDQDYELDDDEIFRVFSSLKNQRHGEKLNFPEPKKSKIQNHYLQIPKQKYSRTVSKSVGYHRDKSQSKKFSKNLAENLTTQIITILERNKISQIKLVNMREEEIYKIKELTQSQKTLIIKNVLKNQQISKKTPTYEESLEKTFTKRKPGLLRKFKDKKLDQSKLLEMDSEIRDLSFLSESEKLILPAILNEYKDQKDFNSLTEDIQKSIAKGSQA